VAIANKLATNSDPTLLTTIDITSLLQGPMSGRQVVDEIVEAIKLLGGHAAQYRDEVLFISPEKLNKKKVMVLLEQHYGSFGMEDPKDVKIVA